MKQQIDEMYSGYDQEIKALEKQRSGALRKIDNLLDLAEGGQIDDLIRQRIAENKARIADAAARMKQIKGARASRLDESQITARLSSFAQKEKSPENIKAIMETFLDNVTVSKGEVFVKLRLFFEW